LTETVADCAALPPFPVQERVKVALAVSAPVDWVPLRALVPDQAPEAVQAVALVDDHVRAALAPLLMALGPNAQPDGRQRCLDGDGRWTASHCPWGRYRSACRFHYL